MSAVVAPDLPESIGRSLVEGRCSAPHDHLGVHDAAGLGARGSVVRALQPDAERAWLLLLAADPDLEPLALPMAQLEGGLFSALLEVGPPAHGYRFRFELPGGRQFERADPYGLWPTLGEQDLHLFNEGRHMRLWQVLGAHARVHQGHEGVAFAVWAPAAERVSVVGDFCGWEGRTFPMRALGASGVFEIFIPGVQPGALYQYEIRTHSGDVFLKADPFAMQAELPPGRASRVAAPSQHEWRDGAFRRARRLGDPRREPMAVYEAHFGSFRREHDGSPPGYRSRARDLVHHALHFGFTHIELMPLCEHPFDGSWGYQVTGFFAPTARYGTPDELRYLIDLCHQHGIGVILDWVPAHFPRDTFALARFDGTALYEHADPRRGEHPDWGTYIFNYARHEVRNFLLASALYWLEEFHIDGLRVDAVASMLYRDYSRPEGEWVPNDAGGREDEGAVAFLRELNHEVHTRHPECFTVAEESTSWPGVTRPVDEGGLGFTFKWNLGWMHDTLSYFGRDPIHRRHHQDELTFAMVYEHSEAFVMPLSHDEVVHGKGSLLRKMPGDAWQAFANLRALFCYQYLRPGKKLLFMGSELASEREWNHDGELPWAEAQDPLRQGLQRMLAALGAVYRAHPCLWRGDPDPQNFEWVDTADHAQSVLSFFRRDGSDLLLVVLNLTPMPRNDYRIGAPQPGRYRVLLDSDASAFGGSGFSSVREVTSEPRAMHGRQHSLGLTLPPLGVLVLQWQEPPEGQRLADAAERAGVLDAYHSLDGTQHVTSDAMRRRLLAALGSRDAGLPPQGKARLQVDAARVLQEGDAASGEISVRIEPPGYAGQLSYAVEHRQLSADLGAEDARGAAQGTTPHAQPRRPSGEYRGAVGEVRLPWASTLPSLGQHALRMTLELRPSALDSQAYNPSDDVIETVERVQSLFVVPPRAYDPWLRPPDGHGAPAGLGLWIQLYALRSEHDFGIGDLAHLRRLCRWAGALGLDFIGLNPLHAPSLPDHPVSPYFPSSRIYRSPLYLDLEAVPELQSSPGAQALLASDRVRAERVRLQRAARIDYRAVEALKRPLLEQLADTFLEHVRGGGSPRALAFDAYLHEQGEALQGFATFCVLQRELGEQDFRRWPAALQDPRSPEVERLAAQHGHAIARECFFQFELDRQLAAVAADAREAGMAIGLYLDLAVGSTHGGADAWQHPGVFLAGLSLGAPPDPLAPQGQDWGLAAVSPAASAAQAHGYLRSLLRANMRHAGALRIDHAIGLCRQFLIPDGDAEQGAYLKQPLEEFLGLIAAESRRARCVVIGEDLGTVPDGLREAMAAWGLLRMQVACFELDDARGPALVRDALAVLDTHDLAPFASFWSGADLAQRHGLGLCTVDELATAEQARAALRARWVATLVTASQLAPECDPEKVEPLRVLDATHLWLASSDARMVALSFADLCDEHSPVNLPGTTAADGFESWCTRHERTLERMLDSTELAARIALCLEARREPQDMAMRPARVAPQRQA